MLCLTTNFDYTKQRLVHNDLQVLQISNVYIYIINVYNIPSKEDISNPPHVNISVNVNIWH